MLKYSELLVTKRAIQIYSDWPPLSPSIWNSQHHLFDKGSCPNKWNNWIKKMSNFKIFHIQGANKWYYFLSKPATRPPDYIDVLLERKAQNVSCILLGIYYMSGVWLEDVWGVSVRWTHFLSKNKHAGWLDHINYADSDTDALSRGCLKEV